MRIERNGKYWRLVTTDASGRRITRGLGTGTKRQAMARARDIAPAQVAKRMRMSDWVVRYLEQRQMTLDPRTLAEHRICLEKLVFFTGDCMVRSVSAMAVADFVGQLRVAENTRRKYVRYLRTVWKHAIDQGVAAVNPWSTQPASHRAADRPDVYVAEDTVMGLANDAMPGMARLLILTRFVGLRLGEAQRACWEDLAEGILVVGHEGIRTTKRRRRHVPVSTRTEALLRGRMIEGATGRIVTGVRDPYVSLAAVQREAGQDAWQQPYIALRASCETDWLQTHALPDVCGWMGHSPKVALDHYHRTKPVAQEVTA